MSGIWGGPVKTAVALLRGAFPALMVATIIPLGLFYLAMDVGSLEIAIGVSSVYAYGMGLWQHRRRGRVSGMLLMTMFMVTVRGLVVLASGQPFIYFVAPVAETVGFGLLFVASLATRECLIVRLARDVVPHVAEPLAQKASLCRWLSVVWALTYVGSGTTTFLLLISQPVSVYLGAHEVTGWAWDGAGIATSVLLCRWRARDLLAIMRPQAPAPLALTAGSLVPVEVSLAV